MSFNQSFSAMQALSPKRSSKLPMLLLVAGILIALGAAAYGYIQQARVEKVVIALHTIPFGRQITADDLGLIEVPYHRPVQLAGMVDPAQVIGRWAGREISPNDLIEPGDLLAAPPDQPVYPNGRRLGKDMVPLPFSTTTIGPLTEHDMVNIGYSDPTGDPALCRNLGGLIPHGVPSGSEQAGRPYACRFLSKIPVLYIDEAAKIAYLEVTPYQAHAVWSLHAAGLAMWGERYGSASDPLTALARIDAAQIEGDLLLAPTETLKLRDGVFLPGSTGGIPGSGAPSEQPSGQ